MTNPGNHPALGNACHGGLETLVGEHPGFEPAANQPEHLDVLDHLGHFPQQAGVTQVGEEPLDVELGHPPITSTDRLPHPPDRLLSRPARPVAEAARQEPGLKERFKDLPGGLLHHPVGHRGNAQRPHPTVRLGDLHPPHRRGHVTLRRQQPPAQRHQLMIHISFERRHALAVDPAGPAIGPDRSPRLSQVDRIGYHFQQLAHRRVLLRPLSRSPHPMPPGGPPAPPRRLVPLLSPGTAGSLRGLVSVGPFASTHSPLGPSGRPPTISGGSAGITPPSALLRAV